MDDLVVCMSDSMDIWVGILKDVMVFMDGMA